MTLIPVPHEYDISNELSWYEYRKWCKLTLVNIENSNMNMIPTMNCPGMNIVSGLGESFHAESPF